MWGSNSKHENQVKQWNCKLFCPNFFQPNAVGVFYIMLRRLLCCKLTILWLVNLLWSPWRTHCAGTGIFKICVNRLTIWYLLLLVSLQALQTRIYCMHMLEKTLWLMLPIEFEICTTGGFWTECQNDLWKKHFCSWLDSFDMVKMWKSFIIFDISWDDYFKDF